MAARHHNNHNDDDGFANDHDDCAAGRGTADCWASQPGDGFPNLHRLTTDSARERHCGTVRNRADFYERNRRVLLIPLSGGLVELRLASCGEDVGDVGPSLITPVWRSGHTPEWSSEKVEQAQYEARLV